MRKLNWQDGALVIGFCIITIYFKTALCESLLKASPAPQPRHLPMQDLVGIYIEEQRASPLFYDTFFPVVYEVPAPTWNATNLRLQLPKYQNFSNASQLLSCNDPNNTSDMWASSMCPITLKLNELLDDFAEKMKVFETFNASLSKLDSSFSSCHEVKPHFSNHIIDEIEIELYLVQVILDCPLSDVIHHRLYIPEPNVNKYAEILKSFLETHISPKFRIIGYSKYAIATNTLLSIHTTELMDYLLNSFQWTTSINTCNTQRIPRLLVSQEQLKFTLNEIEKKLGNQDLMLTVPISDVSNYYKLPLADCVMTTTKSYIIRVLIPLTRKSQAYRMIQVKSIPFLNKDNASSKAMICQHRTVEGPVVVQGSNSNTLTPVTRMKCEESQLCGIPQAGDRQVFTKCLYSALRSDQKGMIESCHMSCIPYDTLFLPYIKRIRSDQFVIVGKSSAEIAIVCKKEEKPIEVVGIPEFVGSLIVTLPCTCYLSHRSEKYEINGACDFQLEFKPVRPKGWTNEGLLSHFHHHHAHKKEKDSPDMTIMKHGTTESNDTNGDDMTEKEDVEDFNEVVMMGSSSSVASVVWPIYLAYVIMLLGTVVLVFGFYILRNVYVRIGQLEMSTALTPGVPTRGIGLSEMQYNRNAPVQFRARAAFNSNDVVY